MKRIIKNLLAKLNLAKELFILLPYYFGIKQRKGVLVYVGFHRGESFLTIFYRYKASYAFEANPTLLKYLPKRLHWFTGVHIYNKAVSDKKGELKFNISNDLVSSSIANEMNKKYFPNIKMTRTITVPSINLMEFLKEKRIDFIDEYVSDLQGYDLMVLKTLEPMIKNKKIKNITCEVDRNGFQTYLDAPDNSIASYEKYLGKDYYLFATGYGHLKKKGEFLDLKNKKEPLIFFDAKWQLKPQG